ncbi:MFS transporter [Candidatus Bathyarchaeota archaeon]|nr:MFS transporter [Candidatus Bathyarchaeota archaeon]
MSTLGNMTTTAIVKEDKPSFPSSPMPSTPTLPSPSDKEAEASLKVPIPTPERCQPKTAAPTPYTLLSPLQRKLVALTVGLATMFFPLTANIYLPCMPLLQRDFGTTLQLMNLTVTGYVVVQGIAPTLFSQLSETLGRRPVYLITFSLFVASSVALASIPQGDYAALLTLRMLQSFGSSVSTSIGYAVVADIAAPAERGGILAPVMLMLNLGPVIAPVIGGPMCWRAGWRWIFWFLAMFGSAFLLVMALFLPETNRKIVGNGSIAAKGVSRPPLPFLMPRSDEYEQPVKKTYPTTWAKVKIYAPNPLKSAVLIFEKDTACVLFAAGIFYMMYYLSQASLPALFREAYGFSETEIGLCYLALGSGVFFGSQLQGKLARHVLKSTRLKTDLL